MKTSSLKRSRLTMSGVVISLNEDEEEDVAGLLDGDDEDELDLNKSLNGLRAKKSRGYGRRKNYVRTVGSVGQLLNTLIVCCIFFGIVRKIQI